MNLYDLYDEITEVVKKQQSRSNNRRLTSTHPEGWQRSLSTREIEIIQLVADGKTNAQIGEILGLSRLTIKTHLRNIGLAIGHGRREVIVVEALRAGVIQ